jgi:Na+/H+-dicarboxylate symporter
MSKIKNMKSSFSSVNQSFISDAMIYIRSCLEGLQVNKKLIQKTELISEEIIADMASHAPEGADLKVNVKKFFGETTVNITMKGEEFSPYSDDDSIDEDSGEWAIRSVLLRSFGESFKYNNKNNTNHVRIVVGQSEQHMNNAALYALILGVVFGLIVKFLFPLPVSNVLCSYILQPIKTVFMNGIKIIIAPVVFFSIVSCFSSFGSLSEVGKIGTKVIGVYLLTTFIAVFVAMGVFHLIQPGEFGFALNTALSQQSVNLDTSIDTSIMSTLINIVPTNFLSPFLESDTLQLIFLAVMCGISIGMVGQYSAMLKELFEALNTLFLTVTTLITHFIPIVAFVSTALLIINLSFDSLMSIITAALTHITSIFSMLCVYGLLILIIGRLNPLTFYKKNKEGMITSFSLSSSSASVPTNIRICTEKMGISPKVANFSIPLGATINMDGACIYMTVFGLFLAKAYGITVTPPMMLSLAVTIVLLSLGAPGVPGCAFICLGVVTASLGIPVEALGLIIAINPILDMLDTMSNTTGDMAAAVIVAKSEGLIDLQKFNSKGTN